MRPGPAGPRMLGRPAPPKPVLKPQRILIDQHPVTNAEFRRFVKDTNHRTTAEITPSAEEFPDAEPDDLVPGSLVFRPTSGPVPLDDWRRWWHWTPGAHWRAPEGPGSSVGGRELHPVVHVSFEDALAYAGWAGKDLPTEVEWEYAARAGRPPTSYAWGDEFMPRGRPMANTWHGEFPWQTGKPPGKDRTTPVGRFPANDWGLVDMMGNVWEWTASAWTDDHGGRAGEASPSCCAPQGPLRSLQEERPERDERRLAPVRPVILPALSTPGSARPSASAVAQATSASGASSGLERLGPILTPLAASHVSGRLCVPPFPTRWSA